MCEFPTKIALRQNRVNVLLVYLVFCWRTLFLVGVISVLLIMPRGFAYLLAILVGILVFFYWHTKFFGWRN